MPKKAEPAKALQTLSPADLQALTSVLVTRMALAAQMGYQYSGDRDIYKALGYELTVDIDYTKYLAKFIRQDIAQAIINRPVEATWRGGFDVLESDDDQETPFEKSFADLYKRLALHSKFARLDRLTGLGKYGLLLLGLNDVRTQEDFAKPVTSGNLNLLWVKPFGEGSAPAMVIQYVTDPTNERYGLPEFYTITVINLSSGSEQIIRVHHSRVIHVADSLLESEIEGTPRLQVVYNRLQDLEKLVGASAEMFWRGARPGHQFVGNEGADVSQAFVDVLKTQFDEYEHNLRRILAMTGGELKSLASQVADPKNHVLIQLQMISAVTQIPLRILVGSEIGKLASEQDSIHWHDYTRGRRAEKAEPLIINPFVERGVKQGWLVPYKDSYFTKWQDPEAESDKLKADIGNTRSTAIKNYASAPGAETIVPLNSFLRICLGLSDEEIELIQEELNAAIAQEPDLEPDLTGTQGTQGPEPNQPNNPNNPNPPANPNQPNQPNQPAAGGGNGAGS